MMKMKRTLSLLLSLIMMFGLLTGCQSNPGNEGANEETHHTQIQEPSTENTTQNNMDAVSEEIQRAISFGLVPNKLQGDYDKVITFRQYSEMLTNLIRLWDESKLSEWESIISLAAQSDEEMHREDGILATAYAMVIMGKVSYSGKDWAFFDEVQEALNNNGDSFSWEYPQFSNWEEIAFPEYNSNYMYGGVIMCALEASHVTALPIFPYDFEEKSAHLQNALTREEAITAVLRLAETESIFADNVVVPENMDFSVAESWEADFLTAVAERKEAILGSTESVACTGTAYYVSNHGDDSNDGLSSGTAWATLDRVKEQQYAPGDGIYFERGGIWRGTVGYFYDGITISAYGEGEKPRFYGSPENGANPEKWTLYSEESNTKIWQYTGTNLECAGIVLNDGQAVAKRVYPWFDGSAYFDSWNRETPFDFVTALNQDLLFYEEINLENQELPYTLDYRNLSTQIYLRCDAGNPGEIYGSIEFITKIATSDNAMIVFENNCVLDNICIMYNAGTAVQCSEFNGSTVQNCEIGWCGTKLDLYFHPADEEPGIWTDGMQLHFVGSDHTLQNNYLHDIDGGGIVFEIGGNADGLKAAMPFISNVMRGNLIERCGDPFYIRNNQGDLWDIEAFGTMEISDNFVLDTGYGWYTNQPSYINPAFYMGHSQNALNFYGLIDESQGGVQVTDNVFCRAYHGLFYTDNAVAELPSFQGNIFAQDYGATIVSEASKNIKAVDIAQGEQEPLASFCTGGKLIVLQPKE